MRKITGEETETQISGGSGAEKSICGNLKLRNKRELLLPLTFPSKVTPKLHRAVFVQGICAKFQQCCDEKTDRTNNLPTTFEIRARGCGSSFGDACARQTITLLLCIFSCASLSGRSSHNSRGVCLTNFKKSKNECWQYWNNAATIKEVVCN